MNKKDKKLLLCDLCARLPYGVKTFAKTHKGDKIGKVITITTKMIDYSKINTTLGELYTDDECFWLDYDLFKPYLRPMSSMTKEELNTYARLVGSVSYSLSLEKIVNYKKVDMNDFTLLNNWLNKRMLDYRGLIPMGLALEAPKEMYNIK